MKDKKGTSYGDQELSNISEWRLGHLMGAFSTNKSTIQFTGGPIANGEYKRKTLGACSNCRNY